VLEGAARAASVGSTGSRLLSGNCHEWEALEADFAAFAGMESALYFGSGYAANLGLLNSLLQPGDIVFSDALNHASIIDGIRLSRVRKVIYPHCDLAALEESLCAHRDHHGAKLIVSETVFSMEGDIAPVARLIEIAKSHGAELVLDEAHAIGVRGPQGRCQRRRVRRLLKRTAPLSRQSRAHLYFQHGYAALSRPPDSRGARHGSRGPRPPQSSFKNCLGIARRTRPRKFSAVPLFQPDRARDFRRK